MCIRDREGDFAKCAQRDGKADQTAAPAERIGDVWRVKGIENSLRNLNAEREKQHGQYVVFE